MRLLGIFLTVLTALLISGGCGKNTGPGNKKINVTDFRGKTISLEKPAERVVCLIESGLSGIYMLGADNTVVGVSTSVYNENVAKQYSELDDVLNDKKIPTPGNWNFVSIENVIALNPDLVILWASQSESIESIEEKGIPCYGVMLKSFNDVYKEITDFGIIFNKEQRADSLINYTKNELNKFYSLTNDLKVKRKAFFMWNQGMLETSGQKSTVTELLNLSGLENVCKFDQEHATVSFEKLIEWNPDIIIMWYDINKTPEYVYSVEQIKNISAVKNKEVFQLPSVFFCDFWTLKFLISVKMAAKWAYPFRFKDYDINSEISKTLKYLYGPRGEKIKF